MAKMISKQAAMAEKAVVGGGDRRFGDEESNLLDRFERMSLEAHLNRALLSRSVSLSEPGFARSRSRLVSVGAPPPGTQVKQRRRPGPGFHNVLKKLLNPILGTNIKRTASTHQGADLRQSRSLRL